VNASCRVNDLKDWRKRIASKTSNRRSIYWVFFIIWRNKYARIISIKWDVYTIYYRSKISKKWKTHYEIF
jgi:hypothetical protein